MSLTGTTLPHVKSWTRGYVFTFHLVCKCFQFFLFDCFLYWYSLLLTCDLGPVCFGCKWFQEIIFRKIGCLVGFENRIFWKSFSFNRKKEALTTEIHFRSYFHFKWFSEGEREREREEEDGAQITPSTSPANPELQPNDCTHQIALVSLIVAPRRSISPPLNLAFDLEPSTH